MVKYNGVPCLPAKCPTNEICVPQFKDYACKCNSKYFDKKCEDQWPQLHALYFVKTADLIKFINYF